jgi:hypothetical protein
VISFQAGRGIQDGHSIGLLYQADIKRANVKAHKQKASPMGEAFEMDEL